MGTQPRPITGRRHPRLDDVDAFDRADAAATRFKSIWVDFPPQQLVNRHIRRYLVSEAGRRGTPITGRRLSQSSQAGKSATVERLVKELMDEEIAAGREPNPYRVIHITIDKRETVKQLYQKILRKLADDFVDFPTPPQLRLSKDDRKKLNSMDRDSVTTLEQRIAEWVVKLGVDLVVVDEVQRLRRAADDASEVTQRLQAFLDRGIVGLVLIGDDTSPAFFRSNGQFSARLLKPLQLRPLRSKVARDRKLFMNFCKEFDRQLVASKATPISNGLSDDATLEALLTVSSGHVGRVARLLEVALPAAIERGAARIEAYDLSNAVRDFAIPAGWLEHDPFEIA